MKTDLKTYLRTFPLLKKSFRSSRDFKNTLKNLILESYFKIKGEKIIYSYFAQVNNFGDLFNYDIIEFFGYKLIYRDSVEKSEVALLGSILQMYTREFDGYILGSGFIHERFNRLGNNWKIHLIRGPLSLAQSSLSEKEIIFGDPGILANLVYGKEVKKKYKLGIVPHASDYDAVKNKFGK